MKLHLFFLFAPAFRDFPFLIAEEVRSISGSLEISGLVTGMENTYRHVSRRLDAAGYAPVDHLAALEAQWLATPVEAHRLEAYEAMLGAEAIQRLIISDRHLGAGFVSGARMPETALNRLSADAGIRRRYLVGLLDYLQAKLHSARPDLVFCYAVAGAPAYAIALLCKHLGIPFLKLTHSRVAARHVIDSSPLGLMTEVAHLYAAPAGVSAAARLEAKEIVRQFRERSEAPQYIGLFHEIQKRNLSTRRLLRDLASVMKPLLLPRTRPAMPSLRHPDHWQRAKHRSAVWLAARRSLRSGTFCPPEHLPKSNYVYYPLHFDPEASTMVFAPYHTDQVNVVETLAKSTPASMTVVVKEHLPMVGLRPDDFYNRLKRIPGVVVASPACDSFELIRAADVTVAITGTAAWEALLLGKPAITLGEAPFNVVGSGIWNCPDPTKLAHAIATARQSSSVDDEPLVRYLAAIVELSFDLPYELLWTSVTEAQLAAHRPIATFIARRIVAATGAAGQPSAAGRARAEA